MILSIVAGNIKLEDVVSNERRYTEVPENPCKILLLLYCAISRLSHSRINWINPTMPTVPHHAFDFEHRKGDELPTEHKEAGAFITP